MMDQENVRSLYDVFASSQETFEDAKKKSKEESSKRASFLRFAKDGTYTIRILPLAPVQDQDGNFLPLERKGYEYPLRSLMLKIENAKKLVKGKPSITYVTVCNAKYVFKNIDADLIDTYVAVACEKYADDEKLCKKLREGSFSGGLKWDSRRCMYVIDLDNTGDGIQILQLSYSQYKDLEERKLNLWAKLNKNGKNVPCPISSIDSAYPVEITRKSENNKPAYSFNIDTVSDKDVLDEETLAQLIDMPRLPEQIYRYTRYHLEATIAYLEQLDEKFDINVMDEEKVQNCIEQIKTLLPADDQSHFTLGEGKEGEDEEETANDIDALWDRYDALCNDGLDDQTAEGQELRTSIMAYIEANDLNVKVTRKKTNEDILNEIEDELANTASKDDDEDEEEEAPAPVSKRRPAALVEEEDEEDAEPAQPGNEEEEDEESERPARSRRERNDDTNEPAARASRRGARPPRRRD
ncbi:hypothetical protein [Phocaeicola vulgatus]|uniref:hypothetical protein n=1 Tax=Phocaeicola vulgatus TaxID=821 RepID=UPI0011C44581|nr:hypothetical protein [Phocaeicola vulgatus]